uniref:Uncharacterized protein n=1 Tax=Setaria digitata TaxID=48799 RepID=A0A915Q258_9BILA
MRPSTMNWLLGHGFAAITAPTPRLPVAAPNMDMIFGEIPPQPFGYMPALVDEHHLRRRRQVSVTYTDPSGGSTVVTRRREDGHLDVRLVYSREFIVAASASPLALLPPANFREMVLDMMEIIAKFPKSYYNTIRRQDSSSSSSE